MYNFVILYVILNPIIGSSKYGTHQVIQFDDTLHHPHLPNWTLDPQIYTEYQLVWF